MSVSESPLFDGENCKRKHNLMNHYVLKLILYRLLNLYLVFVQFTSQDFNCVLQGSSSVKRRCPPQIINLFCIKKGFGHFRISGCFNIIWQVIDYFLPKHCCEFISKIF